MVIIAGRRRRGRSSWCENVVFRGRNKDEIKHFILQRLKGLKTLAAVLVFAHRVVVH
jgi:hypothetical protein